MLTIKKGSTRIVLIIFNWLVFKFPSPLNMVAETLWRGVLGHLRQGELRGALKGVCQGKIWRFTFESVIDGLCANLTEAWLWSRLKDRSTFLQPTLTFFLFNLQKYAGEEMPESMVLEDLPKEALLQLFPMDAHQRCPSNWRRYRGRLKLIDYGGGGVCDVPSFPRWLFRWHKELEAVLATQ